MARGTRNSSGCAGVARGSPGFQRRVASPAERTGDIDSRRLRLALGQFATGVTVVTATDQRGELIGMTMSSFNSVSLDPPLILFSVARNAYSLQALRRASTYTVNVLSENQENVSNQFAVALENKWEGVDYVKIASGAPRLDGSLAWFDCRPWAEYDGGDHLVFVGRVVDLDHRGEREPLIFFRGKYASVDTGSARDTGWGDWPLPIHY